jgi:hypothetical protein
MSVPHLLLLAGRAPQMGAAKGGDAMTPSGFMIAVLLVAVLMIFIWRQVIKLVAAAAVTVFCFGLYHLVQIMHR